MSYRSTRGPCTRAAAMREMRSHLTVLMRAVLRVTGDITNAPRFHAVGDLLVQKLLPVDRGELVQLQMTECRLEMKPWYRVLAPMYRVTPEKRSLGCVVTNAVGICLEH
jgi:hypothetical protein